MSSRQKRRFVGEAILKHALRWLFPGWQGVWKDWGRFLAQISAPEPGTLTSVSSDGGVPCPPQ